MKSSKKKLITNDSNHYDHIFFLEEQTGWKQKDDEAENTAFAKWLHYN